MQVPVPEREREGVVSEDFSEDAFVEVDEHAVPGHEQPSVVNLQRPRSDVGVVERVVAVQAVQPLLVTQRPRVDVRQRSEELVALDELLLVSFVQ